MIVAPHPDDECIGVGGVLALYAGQCEVIVLTDGRVGQGDISPEIVKGIRRAEFVSEMEFLGIRGYRILEYEDGSLMQHTDCLRGIDLSIYTKIFVTGMQDNHPDHTAACISVYQTIEKQCIRTTELFFYEVHAPLQEVTHMLDITEVMEQKQRLVRFHQSQLNEVPYDRYVKSMAEYRALQNRMSEGFVEVYVRMPVERKLYSATMELEERLQKSIMFYQILTRWVELKICGHSVAEWFIQRGYRRIAVYGYAELGMLLCRELSEEGLDVVYVLDRKVKNTGEERLPVFVPRRGLPKVDVIVVTAVYYFEEIKKGLSGIGFQKIDSLRKIIEESHFNA